MAFLGKDSVIKKLYESLALIALLNVVAVAGVMAVLLFSGRLDGLKSRRIIQVMRGEVLASEMPPEPAAPEVEPETEEPEVDVSAAREVDDEILRREATRINTEIEQRLALMNRILLQITTEREAFESERAEVARREQETRAQRHDEGFKKQVEIIEQLSPKAAVEHLLAIGNPDQAALVLSEMETRKAKKIIEAAKEGTQLVRMQDIVQRVRTVASNSEDGAAGNGANGG